MIWLLIVSIGFAVTVAIFWLLQWRSGKIYKPKKEEIRKILQLTIDGAIEQETFDQFSHAHILYNCELDAIRKKYNQIVNDPECVDRVVSPDLVVPLNETGKSKLRELVDELDAVAT